MCAKGLQKRKAGCLVAADTTQLPHLLTAAALAQAQAPVQAPAPCAVSQAQGLERTERKARVRGPVGTAPAQLLPCDLVPVPAQARCAGAAGPPPAPLQVLGLPSCSAR